MSLELFSLEGKVAVVTGASRGIGRAVARGLAGAGADVVVSARDQQRLQEVAGEIRGLGRRALVVTADVNDRAQIEHLVKNAVEGLGGIDVMVNNAGGTRFVSPILGLRPEGWDKVLRLNLDSVFHGTQLAAQVMAERGGGSIIQISSVAGIEGAPGLSFYSAAKGGVRLLTQSVAKELAASGVRVNVIAPGWVATDLNEELRQDPAARAALEAEIPMGRFGDPQEIVGAAVYLASDASSFVTGATIVVDGGQTA